MRQIQVTYESTTYMVHIQFFKDHKQMAYIMRKSGLSSGVVQTIENWLYREILPE